MIDPNLQPQGSRMNEQNSVKKRIGPVGLLFIGTGSIIGSGWLFAALYAAQDAGPSSVVSWALAAIMLGVIALVFAELGAALPLPGGFARYPHVTFGGLTSFIASWLCWLAYMVIPSVETMAILEYLGNEVPWLITTHQEERSLSIAGTVIASGLLFSLMIINILGVQWVTHSNNVITLWKILIPIMTGVVLLLYGFQATNFTEFGLAPKGVSGIFEALAAGGVVFSLLGYRTIVELAGEARKPQRDVPIAIFGSLLICTVIFILVQIAFIGVLPPEQLANGWNGIVIEGASGPFAAFALLLGLGWLATILYIDATISPYGTALIFTSSSARLVLAMGKNRNVPGFFSRISSRGIPVRALVVNWMVGMMLLAPLPGWDELAGIVSSVAMLTSAVSAIAFLALRRSHPELNRPFKAPFPTACGVVAFVFASLIAYWTGWTVNRTVLLDLLGGLALLALTIPGMNNGKRPLHVRHALWMVPWLGGIFALSWASDYPGGVGLIKAPWGECLLIAWCLALVPLAMRSALGRERSDELISGILEEIEEADRHDTDAASGEIDARADS